MWAPALALVIVASFGSRLIWPLVALWTWALFAGCLQFSPESAGLGQVEFAALYTWHSHDDLTQVSCMVALPTSVTGDVVRVGFAGFG